MATKKKTALARVKDTTKLAAAEKKRLEKIGRTLVLRVKKLKGVVERSAYDMGVALTQLKQRSMYQALGYENFAALCNVALHISPDHADQLITISQTFTKKQAGTLTTSKALSLVALSRALGGHHAPAALRSRRALDVGHGKTIDVTAASAEDIHAVAHDLRARSGREPTRGLHVPPEEQAFVKRLAAALKSRGAEGAKVTAVAGPKSGAKMRVEIAIHDAALLARALADART